MRIAIIGVGNVGSALARAFRTAGHTVVVSSRRASLAEKIAEELGVSAASSNRAVAENAEMVVLAVPAKAVASVLDETAEFLDGTIVVDPTNPADEDAETVLRASASLAEAVVLLAPGARVVKAFNTVFASRLNDPAIDGIPLDGFYAGDDAQAKQVVADLLADMGFRPVDTGELLTARALELMAFLNISLNARGGWPWRSGWKLLGPVD
ncbi:NADPH-dependent F420 reductase [Actinoplanes sp. NPDC051411]|jgi:NADPH-dependent F420 reductase|uniref:NADPH-dependent F420 reductase n=1 Tax=Actinoplanes sp. NPDC051411 TaxID=3155522 RepID=UPI00343F72AF